MTRRTEKIIKEQRATAEKGRAEKRSKDKDTVLAGSSSGVKTRKPSFFKEIPPKPVGSFGAETTLVTLKTEIGSWAASLIKTGTSSTAGEGGLWLHGPGWVDFVSDNAFTERDFLVFFFEGESDSLLNVVAFGQSYCLKPPPEAKPKTISHFTVTFKRFNLHWLLVPSEFVEETGMWRRKRVVVKDWEGREWAVTVRKKRSGGGLRLGDGWAAFVEHNALRVGMTCVFQTDSLRDAAAAAADDDVFVLLANPLADRV